MTLLNVHHTADEFFPKNKMVNSEEKAENNHRKWFKDNFINSRSLKHACSIHRWVYVLQLQGKIIENLFCYMIFSTYTVILIKCYILMSVLVIIYCYTTNLLLLICPDCPSMLYSYVRACQILRNVEKWVFVSLPVKMTHFSSVDALLPRFSLN